MHTRVRRPSDGAGFSVSFVLFRRDDSQGHAKPDILASAQKGSADRRMVRDLPESCHLCGGRFASVADLILHSEEYHQQATNAVSRVSMRCFLTE